jgi:lipopolysaccharide transport protein LptA
MAASSRNDRKHGRAPRRRTALLLGAALAVAPVQAAELNLEKQLDLKSQLDYVADIMTLDMRADMLDLAGNVRVVQGPLSIESGTATATAQGRRSGESRWTFQGEVRIHTTEAELQADTARAAVVDGRIASARIEGNPAMFEQQTETPERRMRGRAGVIEYDFAAGIIKLTGDVWFSNGKDEFRGDVVIYDVRGERVQINPGGREPGRVRGTIRPREREAPSPTAPEAS